MVDFELISRLTATIIRPEQDVMRMME